MKENELKDVHELQGYFNQRVHAILGAKGKRIMGWDEILDPSLPTDALVHSWRGQNHLVAVRQGHECVRSDGYYLDHSQPASFHYKLDPLPPAYQPDSTLATGATGPDTAAPWFSWDLEISGLLRNMEGRLTLAGAGDDYRGEISIFETGDGAKLREIRMSESGLSFQYDSRLGQVSVDLKLKETAAKGTLQSAGFTHSVSGVRSAGSDMPGTALAMDENQAPLTREQEARVLGGEACMWSELVNPETIDSRIWPRLAAVAEKFWSPASLTRDEDDMYRRLAIIETWLSWTGLRHKTNFTQMLKRLTAHDIAPLITLSETLEPVKFSHRHLSRAYSQFTPLNRLVDAIPVENTRVREFSKMIDGLLEDRDLELSRSRVRAWLTRWRDNHDKLQPTFDDSYLLKPVEPLSRNLSDAAALGLDALERLQTGNGYSETEAREHLSFLDRAKEPVDELILGIVPFVRKLVEAAQR